MRTNPTWLSLLVLVTLAPEVQADKKRPATATKADVDRLESRIEEQQKQIDRLTRAQQKYLEALKSAFDSPVSSTEPKVDAEPKVEPKPEPKPAPATTPKADIGFTDARPPAPIASRPRLISPSLSRTSARAATAMRSERAQASLSVMSPPFEAPVIYTRAGSA